MLPRLSARVPAAGLGQLGAWRDGVCRYLLVHGWDRMGHVSTWTADWWCGMGHASALIVHASMLVIRASALVVHAGVLYTLLACDGTCQYMLVH